MGRSGAKCLTQGHPEQNYSLFRFRKIGAVSALRNYFVVLIKTTIAAI
jgi:hypothetical protein